MERYVIFCCDGTTIIRFAYSALRARQWAWSRGYEVSRVELCQQPKSIFRQPTRLFVPEHIGAS